MRNYTVAGLLVSLAVAACVTINVYFPEAAAEQAADTIIKEVLGNERENVKEKGPDSAALPEQVRPLIVAAGRSLLNFFVPVAHAAADIEISSPGVRRIRASMTARNPELVPFYDSGAVGFTSDAMVAIRDLSAVGLRDRNRLRQLVADENKDRDALYREIAVANGQPEWEDDIRQTFARRWVANARPGWYYQDESGSWRTK